MKQLRQYYKILHLGGYESIHFGRWFIFFFIIMSTIGAIFNFEDSLILDKNSVLLYGAIIATMWNIDIGTSPQSLARQFPISRSRRYLYTLLIAYYMMLSIIASLLFMGLIFLLIRAIATQQSLLSPLQQIYNDVCSVPLTHWLVYIFHILNLYALAVPLIAPISLKRWYQHMLVSWVGYFIPLLVLLLGFQVISIDQGIHFNSLDYIFENQQIVYWFVFIYGLMTIVFNYLQYRHAMMIKFED